MIDIKNVLSTNWYKALNQDLQSDYFQEILNKLDSFEKEGKQIFPKKENIFKVLSSLDPKDIKVVILGQDPYHNIDQAMGLSFSVPKDHKTPPSLKNIFKELSKDINFNIPDHGDLTEWSNNGIFLLNAILTVEHNKPGSHKKIGWQNFTDSIIKYLSTYQSNIVFMLWGNFAKEKAKLIDGTKHLILESPHPSPLARGGFFNNNHFSKANDYMSEYNIEPIDWTITNISPQVSLNLK